MVAERLARWAAFWAGVQLDEVGFPILLAAKLDENGALDGLKGVAAMILAAAGYLARNGPISPQDRWEENPGISPFTLGIEIVALVAAADRLPAADRLYALSLADYWNERLEDWTYVESGAFIEEFGVEGHYVRIAPAMADGGLCGRVDVRNRVGEGVPAVSLIGMEYLYLPRLGLRDPRDPRIQNTLKITDSSSRSRRRTASPITAITLTATASTRMGAPSTAPASAAPGRSHRRARLSRCSVGHRSAALPGDDDANDRTGGPHPGTSMGRKAGNTRAWAQTPGSRPKVPCRWFGRMRSF